MRENGLKLPQGKLRFNIRKKFRMLNIWLPRVVVELLSLEKFKSHLNVALGDVVQG